MFDALWRMNVVPLAATTLRLLCAGLATSKDVGTKPSGSPTNARDNVLCTARQIMQLLITELNSSATESEPADGGVYAAYRRDVLIIRSLSNCELLPHTPKTGSSSRREATMHIVVGPRSTESLRP